MPQLDEMFLASLERKSISSTDILICQTCKREFTQNEICLFVYHSQLCTGQQDTNLNNLNNNNRTQTPSSINDICSPTKQRNNNNNNLFNSLRLNNENHLAQQLTRSVNQQQQLHNLTQQLTNSPTTGFLNSDFDLNSIGKLPAEQMTAILNLIQNNQQQHLPVSKSSLSSSNVFQNNPNNHNKLNVNANQQSNVHKSTTVNRMPGMYSLFFCVLSK